MSLTNRNKGAVLALGALLAISMLLALSKWTGPGDGQWELHTAAANAPGSLQIESGQFDSAIAVLVAAQVNSPDQASALVLNNLCLAYLLKHHYVTAMEFCDMALAQPIVAREAYNARGVLHALRGNPARALADLEIAACTAQCPQDLSRAGDPPHPLFQRNLERARRRFNAKLLLNVTGETPGNGRGLPPRGVDDSTPAATH